MSSVGDRIRKLRKERGWTQADLAKKVNKSAQVVSNWERGYSSLAHEDITNLVKVFNVPADEIIETEPTKKNLSWDLITTALKIEELAKKYDMDVSDPIFKEILAKAFDFAATVNRKDSK